MKTISLLSLLIIFVTSCETARYNGEEARSYDIWFDEIRDLLVISTSDGNELVKSVAEAVIDDKEKLKNMPEALKGDNKPRIVFISVSDGKSPAQVFLGTGIGLESAINQAIYNIKRSEPSGYNPSWIKIDFVVNVYHPQKVDLDTSFNINRSLEGIAFDREIGVAFLPEELVSNTLVNEGSYLRADNINQYLDQQKNKSSLINLLEQKDPIKIHRFTTESYFVGGETPYRLYRGHRMFDQISPEILVESAKNGGDYLKRSVRPEGSFTYIYRPDEDEVPKAYNILRHAGTVYSMLELYEVTGDPELLQSTKRAIDYLIKSIKPCQIGSETLACVVEGSIVKLGGNALAVVALAKYIGITNEKDYMPMLLRLARWIQKSQRENGQFFPHIQSYPGGEASDIVSQYYPGEAILALMRIYELNGDESFLDSAERGAQYLINVRDKNLADSELNHDHWLLYGLNELYRHKPKPLYLNHSMRIAKAMIQSQNRDPQYPDWFGGYYRPPRSTPTAVRSEGLYAAYQLARDFGDPNEAQQILESLENGIRFQLQTQFRPESVLYLKKPQRALGGFHSSLTNFEIRNDYVQHNISSILGLYRIQSKMEKNEELPDEAKSKISLMKILFVGDTSFGENYQSEIERRGGDNVLKTRGYDYPLQKLKPLLSQSDLVIANLETPITNLKKSPLSGKKNYIHWADISKTPKYLADHNIRTISLANNHSLDYGTEGLKQTLEELNRANIEWFGAGLNDREAGKPYIREFRIGDNTFRLAVIGAFEYRDNYDRDYNFYANGESGGVNSLSPEKISQQVKEIKNTNPETFVVIFSHWGENYKWKSEEQTELAHKMIDSGADLIIGHGAHIMQEVEFYRGHWILYNLGNFMFNVKGRYQKYNVEPFSLATQLVLLEKNGRLEKHLRLYPLFTDNLITKYQSRFLTESEFKRCYRLLLDKSGNPRELKKVLRTGRDDIGSYMEITL